MEIKNEHRLTEVEAKVAEHDRDIADIKKRQNDLEKLTGSVEVLAVREKNVENTVNEIKDDVKSLKNVPANKWNSFVEKAISAVVGGVVGYVLFRLGIGM